jgi:hypothetical protein
MYLVADLLSLICALFVRDILHKLNITVGWAVVVGSLRKYRMRSILSTFGSPI